MKIEIEIKFTRIGKEEVTKELLERDKGLPASTIKVLEGITGAIEKYFSRNSVKISKPKCLLNTEKGLKGIISFELLEVMRHKITPQIQTSAIMKAFEGDMNILCGILVRFYREKKIDTKIKSRIMKNG